MMRRRMMAATLVLAAGCGGEGASAPPPHLVMVFTEESTAKVFIGPWSIRELSCARGDVLLRENVTTGELVQVKECDTKHPDSWSDACVPAGEYRYGPARTPHCAYTWRRLHYDLARIEAPRMTACSPPPAPWTEKPPWAGSNEQRFTCEKAK